MDNQSLEKSVEVLSSALKELAENKYNTGDLKQITYLNFTCEKGADNYGKGIIFSGQGPTKQIVLSQNPDRFFVSENIDLNKEKAILINRVKVLDSQELGPTVTKSSLKQVGRLKGLIVDGSVSINQFLYYDANCDRLGLGTEQPNAALSVVDKGIEIIVGVNEKNKAVIGTHATHDVNIVSGSVPRITVKSNGSIDLGNFDSTPSAVRINGKLSVGVSVPDTAVDLHVAGAVRLNNRLQFVAENAPASGNYNQGDIVWHTNPRVGGNIGWVCTKSGSPGTWNRFGDIR
jgi:hypothetical protein